MAKRGKHLTFNYSTSVIGLNYSDACLCLLRYLDIISTTNYNHLAYKAFSSWKYQPRKDARGTRMADFWIFGPLFALCRYYVLSFRWGRLTCRGACSSLLATKNNHISEYYCQFFLCCQTANQCHLKWTVTKKRQ